MNKKLPICMVAALAVLAIQTAMTAAAPSTAHSVSNPPEHPYAFVRNQVKGITPSQVRKMEVVGPNYMRFSDNPIVVTDKSLIAQLLNGLKNSVHSDLNLADMQQGNTLSVYVRNRKEPLTFDFNPRGPAACFGPVFYKAIKHLASYEVHPKKAAAPRT